MTRRDFLKGFMAAAVFVSIPARELLALSSESESLGYNIFWVSPQDFVAYRKSLGSYQQFVIPKLSMMECLMFKGHPVIPHEYKRTPKTDERWSRFNTIINS